MNKQVGLIYTGRRFEVDSMVLLFIQSNDMSIERRYAPFKGSNFFIGTTYQGTLTENGKCQISVKEADKQCEISQEQETEWRIFDHAHKQMEKNFKAKTKLDKKPIPEHIVKDLYTYCKNFNYEEMKAFSDSLVHELITMKRKKK